MTSFPKTGVQPVTAVLLVAGRGARMRSRRPKALHGLLGKPLARHNVDLCRRLGVERVVVVTAPASEAVRAALGDGMEYVEQNEPRGTGHAMAAAAPLLEGWDGTVLVLPAASVLLTEEIVARLLARHAEARPFAMLLAARTDHPDAAAYTFNARVLLEWLPSLQPDAATGESDLGEIFRRLAHSGSRVERMNAPDPESVLWIHDRVELAAAAAALQRRVLRGHMLNGVTVEDPASTFVDADVTIGQDTVLRPMTYLCGPTRIGEGCDLGPSVRITDCRLADGVNAQFAVLTESDVGPGTRIGPFAQLRPGCRVGAGVKIGNFVELKNAVVEDGASLGHLAYVGDAFVGARANIGAGAITCNYDGKRKHVTRIGAGTFIGSHTTLVAPVEVAEGAYTAAGTVVTENVPPDALAIGRARQENKPGWARKKRDLETHR